jgi:hypothetical protein
MTKIAGSVSGSISQWHGSPDPDPHQNVMDPQHCLLPSVKYNGEDIYTLFLFLDGAGGEEDGGGRRGANAAAVPSPVPGRVHQGRILSHVAVALQGQ